MGNEAGRDGGLLQTWGGIKPIKSNEVTSKENHFHVSAINFRLSLEIHYTLGYLSWAVREFSPSFQVLLVLGGCHGAIQRRLEGLALTPLPPRSPGFAAAPGAGE